jgi:hypothetical protein
VVRVGDGLIVIDPGINGSELDELADDLAGIRKARSPAIPVISAGREET